MQSISKIINVGMKVTTSANVLQYSESKVGQVDKTYFYLKSEYGVDLIKV